MRKVLEKAFAQLGPSVPGRGIDCEEAFHFLVNHFEEKKASLNKAMLIGRLGRDPETRYTATGKAVATFSVATDEGKDKDGKKKPEWHKVVAWEKLAEICQQYLKKGSLVFIEGRITTRKYKSKSGEDRTSTEIVCSTMRMLGDKPDDAPESAATAKANGAPVISDEDIPF